MRLKLFPKENFDKESVNTLKKLIGISKEILINNRVHVPKSVEFYDDISLFLGRVFPQAIDYGLTKEQAREFIKISLNFGTYGTFNIKDNAIIEMNFNPYFRKFYPAIHFLRLLVHESLHLFLYSKLKKDIYADKFKFKGGIYAGKEKIIQLDEGFAEFLTDKLLENFNFDSIKSLPIYSGVNKPPAYKSDVEGLNLEKFNRDFGRLYEKNSKSGYTLIKKEFNQFEGNLNEKIKKLIEYISKEI